MANNRKNTKNNKKSNLKSVLISVLVLIVLFVGWKTGLLETFLGEEPVRSFEPVEGTVELHVIDIGQGDSLLLKTDGGAMVIDTGDKGSEHEKVLRNYLKAEGVESIEYLILTHMDADHIGSADMVIKEFDVKRVILPDLDESDIPTTAVYRDMISALEKSEDTDVIPAVSGETFNVGSVKVKILAPNGSDYPNGDKNDYSVATRLDFGSTSFLLTGDAEKLSENEMLARYPASELKCDFFKAAHHGSSGANSEDFLKAVQPKIVAISCGEGNTYGHPHKEAMSRFEAIGATVYRTDLSGTLVFVSDGTDIVKR